MLVDELDSDSFEFGSHTVLPSLRFYAVMGRRMCRHGCCAVVRDTRRQTTQWDVANAETYPSSCLNVALFARTSSTIKSMAARTRAMPWRSACVTIQ